MHEGNRFAVCLTNFEPVLKQVGDLGTGLCIPIGVGRCALQCYFRPPLR